MLTESSDINPETGIVQSQTEKAASKIAAAQKPEPKPEDKPAPSRRKKIEGDVVPLRAAEEKQKVSAKLELAGDNAKLRSVSVAKIIAPPESKSPDIVEVGLVIDVPVATTDKFPLADLVRQMTQRSENEEQEGHRTTKLSLKRTYGTCTVVANDIFRKKSVKFCAKVKGSPVTTVVDGKAVMRVCLFGRIEFAAFQDVLHMLNNEREWIISPTQGNLF